MAALGVQIKVWTMATAFGGTNLVLGCSPKATTISLSGGEACAPVTCIGDIGRNWATTKYIHVSGAQLFVSKCIYC